MDSNRELEKAIKDLQDRFNPEDDVVILLHYNPGKNNLRMNSINSDRSGAMDLMERIVGSYRLMFSGKEKENAADAH